jgi:HlyD family secretion protein
MEFNPHTPLAGERLRPLGHLSGNKKSRAGKYTRLGLGIKGMLSPNLLHLPNPFFEAHRSGKIMRNNPSKTRIYCLFIALSSWFISGCSNQDEYQAQGYIEGKFTYLSVPQSGQLHQLAVERGTPVKQGSPVFTLDPQPEQSQLENAKQRVFEGEAQVEQAKSALWLAEQTLTRNQDLYKQRTVPKAALDDSQSQYNQAKARLAQTTDQRLAAKASFEQARWAFGQKVITAPKAAQVFDTYYLVGEFVPAGRPIVSLLAPEDIKVIFYINEPAFSTLKLGDTVTVTCDGCPTEQPLAAKVRFISPQNEYTPPVIFSTETRKKLVYRVEAAPSPSNAIQLRPGQPVSVKFK